MQFVGDGCNNLNCTKSEFVIKVCGDLIRLCYWMSAALFSAHSKNVLNIDFNTAVRCT